MKSKTPEHQSAHDQEESARQVALRPFRQLISPEVVEQLLCSFDAPGPRTLREVAMTFLTFSEDELLSEIRADPNQTAFVYDLYAFAEKYAQELTDWTKVMLEVRERARLVSERVRQEMPGIGFSSDSHPRIDVGMSGTA